VVFIESHKASFGVVPICSVLSEHGFPIAPSTYEARHRPLSTRAVRDEDLKAKITATNKSNFRVYGARKVWLDLNRQGTPVARCTVERLMRALCLQGGKAGQTFSHHRP
jgi:putative transposase